MAGLKELILVESFPAANLRMYCPNSMEDDRVDT
jgi:hypothetical protein